MSDTEEGQRIVYVSSKPAKAFSTPTFIIREGHRYFVTLALWEYDREQAETDAQRGGCEAIADLFAKGAPVEACRTADNPKVSIGSHQRIGPPDERDD